MAVSEVSEVDGAVARVSGVVSRLLSGASYRGVVIVVSRFVEATRDVVKQDFTAWGLEGVAVGDAVTVEGNLSVGIREYTNSRTGRLAHSASVNLNEPLLVAHTPGAFPDFAARQAEIASAAERRKAERAAQVQREGVPF